MVMGWWERLAKHTGDDVAWWILFLACSAVGASLLSLSILLRSGRQLTTRAVVGAMLHSSVWGVLIFLTSYTTLRNDLPMLVGLSILSGLGAGSVADIVLMLIKQRLGITITINPPVKPKE
jgi:lipopolysaccharide export LptBFGC system permease protein LptF